MRYPDPCINTLPTNKTTIEAVTALCLVVTQIKTDRCFGQGNLRIIVKLEAKRMIQIIQIRIIGINTVAWGVVNGKFLVPRANPRRGKAQCRRYPKDGIRLLVLLIIEEDIALTANTRAKRQMGIVLPAI